MGNFSQLAASFKQLHASLEEENQEQKLIK
jgi:hypothetical protein